MRRLATIALVAAATAIGVLYWLHDGSLERVVADIPDWNAKKLATLAGIVESPAPVAPPPSLREKQSVGPAVVSEVSGVAEDERP